MTRDPNSPAGWAYRAVKDFGFPAVVAGYLLWQGPKERETFSKALEANARAMGQLAAEVHANTKADEEIRGIARVVCPLCPLPPGPKVKRRPPAPPTTEEIVP